MPSARHHHRSSTCAVLLLLCCTLQQAAAGRLLQQRQCPCPRIFKPVCGADGQMYANQCLLRCAGVAATDDDPADPSACSRIAVLPVGPQQQREQPQQQRDQQPQEQPQQPQPQLQQPQPQQQAGALPPRPLNLNTNSALLQQGGGCRCPKIYLPVCGADGSRYDNRCLAECAGASATPCSNNGRRLQAAELPTNPRQPVGGLGTRCGCPQSDGKAVCGKDGAYYAAGACAATCESGGVSAVRPDRFGNCLVTH